MSKPIVTICARGGSKGVPGKNVRPLLGKPLIVHTIEQAIECASVGDVYVSTDSQQIADIAQSVGATVPFLRPAELSTDDAPKLSAIVHLVEWIESDTQEHVQVIVDLDPTSPLRSVADIEACVRELTDHVDLVITGFEADKNPYFNMVEIADDGVARLSKSADVTNRQAAPAVYAMNASIYVWRREALSRGVWGHGARLKLHVMPRERSIDIDSELDFRIVEMLMKAR